jgi:chemotaxis protein methyltransferase CheR
VSLDTVQISTGEFDWICSFLLERSGIQLKRGKEALVVGRLSRRLRHHGLETFADYIRLLSQDPAGREARITVDLLTTNETYFFREHQHLDMLPQLLQSLNRPSGAMIRVWSAASSTGEEAYSIALTLADHLGTKPWEIVGTDISGRVLDVARRGLYPLDAAERIPERLLRAYCLKGRDEHDGFFTLQSSLRSRVQFQPANLIGPLPDLGTFDVVFLRNVMIYFSDETKTQLLCQLAKLVRPGGYLLIGRAESIASLDTPFIPVSPSVYRIAES